jgi:hypothetical protein
MLLVQPLTCVSATATHLMLRCMSHVLPAAQRTFNVFSAGVGGRGGGMDGRGRCSSQGQACTAGVSDRQANSADAVMNAAFAVAQCTVGVQHQWLMGE